MLRRIVLRDDAAAAWLTFSDPLDVLVASDLAGVLPVIEEADRRVRDDGLFAAGFVTYEAAPAFDEAFVTRAPAALPLACFGLFRSATSASELPSATSRVAQPGHWRLQGPRENYFATIAAIRQQIACGNTYQVNFTVRQHCDNVADAWALFLGVAVDAPYAAFIECDDHAIVSASPELFFELNGEQLICKPMKGTAARGMTQEDDLGVRETLRQSVKDRAENVMIADMVRNDVGRIAEAGSVRAAALFDVEKYRTVWQMTSTVTATTRAPVSDIFRALFPCASVTGAPKVSSMKLIAELESSAREIYTGAIGYLAPRRRARFSVAIRTALIDQRTAEATYGVGGGIVWDSDPAAEYRECLDKAKVLSGGANASGFALLETILWTPEDGYVLQEEHLQRLSGSASYFDFAFDRKHIEQCLATLVAEFPKHPSRVRLELNRHGAVKLEHTAIATGSKAAALRVGLAQHPVDAANPFLYHKTTERSVYEHALRAAGNFDDVLLWNGAREVTESTIANVVVRLEGRLITPPVECGLLAGTFRAKLLREGKVAEGKVSLLDLESAEALFLVNSVRGWMTCRLESRGGSRFIDEKSTTGN